MTDAVQESSATSASQRTDRDTRKRVVVIGIDAASADLVDKWIAEGELPNLAMLRARGSFGRTQGMRGFFVGSTWPSMYTGCSPASHGLHYLTQLIPGTYRFHCPAEDGFVQRPAFWRSLREAGKRVAILDVPLTRLESDFDGVHVVEWGGHDSVYGFCTHPSTLWKEILEKYGPHPVGSTCDAESRTAEDYAAFVEKLEAGVDRKLALTRDMLTRDEWDLFMQVFTEAHCAGHQCWHLHDTKHPAHDAATAAMVGDPLKRVYKRIDAAIGTIAEAAGDASIVVFSAHGMSHWYGATFLLRDILVRLGVTTPLPVPVTFTSRARAAALRIWKALPEAIRVPVRRARRALSSPSETNAKPTPRALDIDATQSRCFVHPNGLAVAGIRLNLAGREPSGVLKPGAEADEFSGWLTSALLEILDDRTGRPLIRSVLRTAELYSGEHSALLPDLLVEWSDDAATGSVAIANGINSHVRARSPLIGMVEGANEYGRTGEHRAGGWIVARGEGIPAGELPGDVSLMDIAPTLTAMLSVTMATAEGKPIDALIARTAGSS